MNDFEIYLQDKVKDLKVRRKKDDDNELNEIELFKLVVMEVTYGELYSVLKNFPSVNVNPILEKCIYIEARIRQYSPDDALTEMRKQMKERSE